MDALTERLQHRVRANALCICFILDAVRLARVGIASVSRGTSLHQTGAHFRRSTGALSASLPRARSVTSGRSGAHAYRARGLRARSRHDIISLVADRAAGQTPSVKTLFASSVASSTPAANRHHSTLAYRAISYLISRYHAVNNRSRHAASFCLDSYRAYR